jgi:hypothetical protein
MIMKKSPVNSDNKVNKLRLDHELPVSIGEWGWKYHHIGIPTKKKIPGETYIVKFKLYVSGFNTSPFGIEWMRFEKESPVSKLIRTVPHIAFEVKNIDHELASHDFKVISEPVSNFEGIKVAMIEHNGTPVELIEFEINK